MVAKSTSAPKEPGGEKPVSPQFVTEVVDDELPQEALDTIKEDAREIEEVVTDIQKKRGEEDQEGDMAAEETRESGEKGVLEEIFTKEQPAARGELTTQRQNGTSSVFLWAVIIISVALLTGGMLLIIASGLPKVPPLFAKPTPTPSPTPPPPPAPQAVLRTDIKLQVLNGGGTPGSAAKAKKFLEEKGYTVEAIGNSDSYTHDETEVHVKPGKEAYLELLKSDLAGAYTIGATSADLPADSPYDARVIVGKR